MLKNAMDQNKREKLIEIGYKIQRCCAFCVNSNIAPGKDWGTCNALIYSHLKHSDSERQLSISRFGWCTGFKLNHQAMSVLGKFAEFLT